MGERAMTVEDLGVREPWERLLRLLGEVDDIQRAQNLLEWDQQTGMPPGGHEGRSEQLATLARIAHERFTSDETGELLEQLGAVAGRFPYDSFEASLVRVTRREYDKARRLPARLVADLTRAKAAAFDAWVQAKAASEFGRFAPHLATIVSLTREKAAALGYEDHPYEALLDRYEPGMRLAQVEALFAALKERLVPLVQAIAERLDRVDDAFLRQTFDPDRQWQFNLEVLEALGYDLRRGRLDQSEHPFTISMGPGDVRITTHVKPQALTSALYSTIHEAGHGMYDQGIAERLARTPLADGASLGVHESQSRLWENIVGRSREFWQHFLPRLQRHFPGALAAVDSEAMYRAVNRVEPSLIRVEADEVTYNLHIMLRFELEKGLVEGNVDVGELPAAWNAKMRSYLGVEPPSDALGVLQDVHWSDGLFGYFPTYTIGNVLSVQLYQKALEAHPEIPREIAAGRFDRLVAWMREHVHRWGASLLPAELIERATGRPLDPEPYLRYIEHKYGELYAL